MARATRGKLDAKGAQMFKLPFGIFNRRPTQTSSRAAEIRKAPTSVTSEHVIAVVKPSAAPAGALDEKAPELLVAGAAATRPTVSVTTPAGRVAGAKALRVLGTTAALRVQRNPQLRSVRSPHLSQLTG